MPGRYAADTEIGPERDSAPTPFRRQYARLKRRFPDTILLFRIGDFYESFDDDAKTLATELEIAPVQIGRDPEGKAIIMAGFLYGGLDIYMERLTQKGYRVAVCDQLSASKEES